MREGGREGGRREGWREGGGRDGGREEGTVNLSKIYIDVHVQGHSQVIR